MVFLYAMKVALTAWTDGVARRFDEVLMMAFFGISRDEYLKRERERLEQEGEP